MLQRFEMPNAFLAVMLLSVVTTLTGCGGAEEGKKTAEVTITITHNGSPVTEGDVRLMMSGKGEGAMGTLNESGFYYIESDVRHFAWQRPEVVDREVLAITFDADGVVENIERYGLEDGQVVPLTRRITRSGDGDISFIRKLFGNIGGINAADFFN
jgi:outer membrane protein assembly factor BamE (lipoprotein component of BamABCDE complex)